VLRRLIWLLVAIPAALLLVTVAISNREPVRMVFDPFKPESTPYAISLPFYAYLFAMLILGVVLGGLATWMSQGRWRRTARAKSQDAMRWQAEADRLARERDSRVQAHKQIAGSAR
jgi:hypothetical protein